MSTSERFVKSPGQLTFAACPLLLLLLLGCGSTGPVLCPADEPQFAVQVSFYDGISHERLLGSTRGEVHDGAYRDSLRVFGYDIDGMVASMAAGRGRAGTYTLTAKRDGYVAYSVSNIQVGSGGCGVIPVVIEAELQPE